MYKTFDIKGLDDSQIPKWGKCNVFVYNRFNEYPSIGQSIERKGRRTHKVAAMFQPNELRTHDSKRPIGEKKSNSFRVGNYLRVSIRSKDR